MSSITTTFKGLSLSYGNDVAIDGTRTSKVFRGQWDDHVVAVKVLGTDASAEILSQRIEKWEALRHQNVHEVFGMSPIDASPLFVVSACHDRRGNIRQYMASNPHIDRPGLLLDVALGMQHLHSCGIIHGCLKPSNILITDDERACVADYGMVEVQSSKSTDAHRFFSPEAWKGTISKPADVFAFAMSAYEVFTSNPPWGVLAEKHIYQHIVHENTRPDRPEPDLEARFGLTDHLWSIIEDAWGRDPRARPSFDAIVSSWQGNAAPAIRVRRGTGDSSEYPAAPPSYDAEYTQTVEIRPQVEETRPVAISPPPPPRSPRSQVSRESVLSHSTQGSSRTSVNYSPSVASRASRLRPRSTVSASGNRSWSSTPQRQQFTPTLPGFQEHQQTRSEPSASPGSGHMTFGSESNITPGIAGMSIRQYSGTSPPLPLMSPPLGPPSRQWDLQSTSGSSNSNGSASAVLLVGALQAEMKDQRKREVVDGFLSRIQQLAALSDKDAEKLITAGAIPQLIQILKIRAATSEGVENVLITLGLLAHDSISANTIYRTSTTTTLIEIFNSSGNDDICTLAVWCLNRICRSTEIANGLMKQNLQKLLASRGFLGHALLSRQTAWCLGSLIHTDATADAFSEQGLIPPIVEHLQRRSSTTEATPEDICAALYPIARISRSIKLAKALTKAGCVPLLAHHMIRCEDPQILNWCARAVGCLMRPNSGDMAKALLEADVAQGLARIPSVLPPEEVEPLASFAFAIQRFSCAEWGGGVRKSLVEAGVVDGLLAALRTAADEPYPQVHIELALAVSFLGDVGGGAIRKEIINAGGIDILKRVGKNATLPEVTKTCGMAVTSITGNLWTRNAASAKTAMTHNWSGGCPDYQPSCPYELLLEDDV